MKGFQALPLLPAVISGSAHLQELALFAYGQPPEANKAHFCTGCVCQEARMGSPLEIRFFSSSIMSCALPKARGASLNCFFISSISFCVFLRSLLNSPFMKAFFLAETIPGAMLLLDAISATVFFPSIASMATCFLKLSE